jgi:hypothetical protein
MDDDPWTESDRYDALSAAFDQGAYTDDPARADTEQLLLSYLYAVQEQGRPTVAAVMDLTTIDGRTYATTETVVNAVIDAEKTLFGRDIITGPVLPNSRDQDVEQYLSAVIGDLENADMVATADIGGTTVVGLGPAYTGDDPSVYPPAKLQDHTDAEYIAASRDVLVDQYMPTVES